MSAITGNYVAPSKIIGEWASRSIRYNPGRNRTAEYLKIIRLSYGNNAAREFRNYLLWLGTYPARGFKNG